MNRLLSLCAVVAVLCAPLAVARTADNRAIMSQFIERFYGQRDVAGAFADHVSADYIQHNPGLPDGPQAAVAALAPMFAAPGSRFDVRHVLVDGDLALVHLHGQGTPGTSGAAVADIYRLKDGKIAEHWDVIQPVEAGTDPLAAAEPAPPRQEDAMANRRRFLRFVDLLFRQNRVEAAYAAYVAADLIQHNARMGQGRAAAIAAIKGLRAAPGATFEVQRVLIDGNLAAVHYRGKLSTDDQGAAIVEIFRFDRGKIVEHWDMFQPIPRNASNAHPMF
ncbi:nuclear transport factor 2 family protein [Sphingobium sp. HBC34]|uniref:Nuclear transport factor 2 family protein n=1 Tax=Sphingobium cyanobacteriorum TaxID=3063954 RepID=A0ABT8ZJJ4_9SPHN|nr:nuclear transport factor 2 family protein [Sphingobium sp. HBC34]MDO7833726.1 nuclear transport factor 2 family protein [Sphingobium sp. HBC34]